MVCLLKHHRPLAETHETNVPVMLVVRNVVSSSMRLSHTHATHTSTYAHTHAHMHSHTHAFVPVLEKEKGEKEKERKGRELVKIVLSHGCYLLKKKQV